VLRVQTIIVNRHGNVLFYISVITLRNSTLKTSKNSLETKRAHTPNTVS